MCFVAILRHQLWVNFVGSNNHSLQYAQLALQCQSKVGTNHQKICKKITKKMGKKIIKKWVKKSPRQKKSRSAKCGKIYSTHYNVQQCNVTSFIQLSPLGFLGSHFFFFDNLDKSQLRRRQIFPQSSQHNFQNKITLSNFLAK